MSVLLFKTLDEEFLESPDLSGPFLLGLLLGVLVLLVKILDILGRLVNCTSILYMDLGLADGCSYI